MSNTEQVVDVVVPDIGDFDAVPVIEILVAVGDTVTPETPLVTLESDKATMDVPSPIAGTVAEIVVKLGDSVSEGSKLLTLKVADAAGAPAGAPAGDTPAEDSPASDSPATDAGSGAGDSPAAETRQDKVSPAGPSPASTPSPAGAGSAADGKAGGAVYASPSVRRLARELSIDLTTVSGSGRGGRILSADVEAATKQAAATSVAGSGASASGGGAPVAATGGGAGLNLAPWPVVNFERFGEVERVPLSRIQKISGPSLARNWAMIPHVTQFDDADITELEAWRKQINSELPKDATKVTLLVFLIKASVAVLKAMPKFNSALDGDELVLRKYYNIGFAADTPNGLVVPVIRDADSKGVLELATELGELAAKARAGTLSPAEISGSTFTISSLGGIGGTAFTPIINAPEVAILGVSRSIMKPVWDKATGSFEPRLMLPLSLSYDHRVIDGAAGARFVVALSKVIADLRRVLL